LTSLQILIVEDDAILCDLLTLRLTKLGHSVKGMYASGEDALRAIPDDRPDIILMDISLSGKMDGIETARQVRLRFDIPVVYLTASTDSLTFERAIKAGDCEYVIKPFTDNDLLIAIELAHHKHKLDRKIKNKQKCLETMFGNLGDAIIGTDEKGVIRYLNPAAVALMGKDISAHTKVSLDELVAMTDNHDNRVEDAFLRLKTETEVMDIPGDVSIRSGDGKKVRVRGSVSPIRDENGRFMGVILSLAPCDRDKALHFR
jgi:PAS domain S-box-containing protein